MPESSDASHPLPKSTAEIFFLCLQQAGDRTSIPRDKAFTLLSNIRLSTSFYSNSSRVAAVQSRLMALKCALLSNPSSEVIAGYFHAQPELCSEIVDLVRPTISPSSVSFTPLSASTSDIQTEAVSAVGESNVIPYSLRTLAIETLTSLVTKKEGSGGGLTPVARQINILAELGVGKGQYLGFLPTLIQYTLASLNTFLKNNQSQPKNETHQLKTSEMSLEDDIALDLGMVFLKATKTKHLPQNELEERALEFIDAVLTLTSAVVSVPSGTAALTDCGLIQALISTIALDSHVAEGENIVGKESYSSSLLKFITAQAIQILEGAIVTQSSALSAFHELHGVELLVSRLSQEIKRIQLETNKDKTATEDNKGSTPMDINNQSLQCKQHSISKPLRAARRVLLFSILTSASPLSWPCWTSPVMLLLEVLAQPTAASIDTSVEESFFTDDDKDKKRIGDGHKEEFCRLIVERNKQSEHISKVAKDIMNAIHGKPIQSSTRKKVKDKVASKDDEKVGHITTGSKNSATKETKETTTTETASKETASKKTSSTTSLPSVPLYMPYLPNEEAELCLPICLDILRRNPKQDDSNEVVIPPPSALVHASFLLLTRILR